MKCREKIGVFCENNTEQTRVHALLDEKAAFLNATAGGIISCHWASHCYNLALIYMDLHPVMCSAFLWAAQLESHLCVVLN